MKLHGMTRGDSARVGEGDPVGLASLWSASRATNGRWQDHVVPGPAAEIDVSPQLVRALLDEHPDLAELPCSRSPSAGTTPSIGSATS